jgi:hypothetical protein
MMLVFCGAPDCGAHASGTVRTYKAGGLAFRLAEASKKKPKPLAIGSGQLKLHEGQQKMLDMYLNKKGRALLEKQGKLDIQATVTITSTGQPTVTTKRTVHVVLKKSKQGKKHH